MKVNDFINKLVHIATNCQTRYKTGGWGQHDSNIWLFDCICLIKGILWGWSEDYNDINGGAKYGSNGVYDDTEIGILNRCSDVSADFSNIQVGEYLYMKGHGGIYIGNGQVVECTMAWDKKVLISNIDTKGNRSKNGVNVMKWEKHGKLPYIEYEEQKQVETNTVVLDWQKAMNKTFNCGLAEDNSFGPDSTAKCSKYNLKYNMGGDIIKWLQARLIIRGFSCGACGVDGNFGPATLQAVKEFQKANGLVVDGIVGINTTLALLK